ncbi:HlyD family secretion protein [Taibaiella chishuiensis]|uniref:HlyD family secretion protein n=2 Tax=Taibaiella chishuiensis TaxID=1434707 RepID=A0A2P8D8B3_9BACT|nr:HlyD family secretion protein [Taibaiella chishuiensis]
MALLLAACHGKKDSGLVLEGRVEREQLSVVSKLPGKIAELRVAEGDEARAGDTLVVLELPEVDARKTQARGAYTSAQAQYDMARKGATANQLVQLKAKVAGLKEQLDFAEKSAGRLKRLLADSLVSQQKYDEVYAKYQGARNQYIAAVAELDDAGNGARAEQQQMALGQQERALGAIDEVNVAEQEKYIRAPQAMSVETITLKQGELALPGYTLVSGFLKQTTYFRFTLPEARLAAVQKGKEVKVYIPYLKKSIAGKVTWIKALSAYANITSAYPDYEQGQTLYEIKVTPLQAADADGLIIKSAVQLDLATK